MILERCPWYIAGPILGVLVVGLRALLNRGFGAVGGYVDVVDHRSPRDGSASMACSWADWSSEGCGLG